MKKKIVIVLLTCVLLSLALFSFAGCNRKLVTVNFYAISYPNSDDVKLEFSDIQWSGRSVVVDGYVEDYNEKHKNLCGGGFGWGFFLDKGCTKKYNLDTKINEDTDLYTLYCSNGSNFVTFCFEGINYYFFVEDINAELTVDSFVVSAYGKELDREKIQFYRDEKMTKRIDITGQTFDTLGVSLQSPLFYYTKVLYVKLAV